LCCAFLPVRCRGDRVRFSEDQAHQLRSVLRLRTGDMVRVFDGLAPVDRLVELVGPGEGAVVDTRPQPPEPKTKLVMYPALLQRDKFEPVLQKLTEVCGTAIAPVITARSLASTPPAARRPGRGPSSLPD